MFDIQTRRAPVDLDQRHALVFVVIRIQGVGEAELPDVVQAGGTMRAVLGLGQSRQQQRGQDRNDRDDYQQLNQRECLFQAELHLL